MARYCAAVMLRTVSVQSGASIPTMLPSPTPAMSRAGSQSYAVWTSTRPAQRSPSSVAAVCFMSRYSRGACDRISRPPHRSALRAESDFHCCTSTVESSVACWISSQPIMRLPCDRTIPCTRSMNAVYCPRFSVSTSSPPMWKYGPGVSAASSRTTSSMSR
jgi:hypothetical protein